MADHFQLTEGVVKVTSSSDVQPLYTAVDVLAYDVLDLLISATFEAPSGTGPLLRLKLRTGTQTATTNGWIDCSTAPDIRPGLGNPPLQLSSWTVRGGFFRYVGWSVNQLVNATAAHFRIDGIGRRRGR